MEKEVKSKYVTVYYQDMGLTLFPEIAAQFGLVSSARIRSDQEYWAVLRANAECGKAECELRIAMAQEFDSEVAES